MPQPIGLGRGASGDRSLASPRRRPSLRRAFRYKGWKVVSGVLNSWVTAETKVPATSLKGGGGGGDRTAEQQRRSPRPRPPPNRDPGDPQRQARRRRGRPRPSPSPGGGPAWPGKAASRRVKRVGGVAAQARARALGNRSLTSVKSSFRIASQSSQQPWRNVEGPTRTRRPRTRASPIQAAWIEPWADMDRRWHRGGRTLIASSFLGAPGVHMVYSSWSPETHPMRLLRQGWKRIKHEVGGRGQRHPRGSRAPSWVG